ELVRDRRARERVMRALSHGPVAVIQPLPREDASPPPSSAVRPVLPESFLPEYDNTPSTFPVALRGDVDEPAPAPPRAHPANHPTPLAGTVTPLAPRVAPERARQRLDARLLLTALLLCALAYVGLHVALAP